MLKIERHHVDKIGCEWHQRERVFLLADCHGEAPPVRMTPEELVELGVELVALGTREMLHVKVH